MRVILTDSHGPQFPKYPYHTVPQESTMHAVSFPHFTLVLFSVDLWDRILVDTKKNNYSRAPFR